MKAEVVQCHTTKWHKNPVSGHEWPEHTLINKWKVSGASSPRTFNSPEKAQEHADFLNKLFDGGFL